MQPSSESYPSSCWRADDMQVSEVSRAFHQQVIALDDSEEERLAPGELQTAPAGETRTREKKKSHRNKTKHIATKRRAT
jgi:hypothetical protein